MYDPTFNAASTMNNLTKRQSCQRAFKTWNGYSVCGQGLSPKRCGWQYKSRRDLIILEAEGAFK